MNDDIAIKVEGVSKSFKLPHEKSDSIKGKIVNFAKQKKGYEIQHALKDISFEVKKGEFFGIVGRNGSGKSTLLKLISGIYTPDKGQVHVNGKLTPFIELGVGFNPELTGRENVFLNGALLGFSRKEMEAMYDEIVEFAELERFMDQKLKNYSSGMQVRLAFSIAIRANTDILVLDEVLAVGDEAFQRKCYDYFGSLKRNGKTVIIVTHDMSAIQRFCNRAILIEDGNVMEEGDSEVVALVYSDILSPDKDEGVKTLGDDSEKNRWGSKECVFSMPTVTVDDQSKYGSSIIIKSEIICNKKVEGRLLIAYAVKNDMGQVIFGDKLATNVLNNSNKGTRFLVSFKFKNILMPGKYHIDLSIFRNSDKTYQDIWLDCGSFRVKTKDGKGFTVIMPTEIVLNKVV